MPRGKIIAVKKAEFSVSSSQGREPIEPIETSTEILGFLRVIKRQDDKRYLKRDEEIPFNGAVKGIDFDDIVLNKTEVTFNVDPCGQPSGFRGHVKVAVNLELFDEHYYTS